MIRPLTITVDARLVFDEPWRGIAKTIVGLYRALAAARPDWRFHLFHRDGTIPNPFADLANVFPRRIDIRGDRFDLWNRVRLPLANRLAGADVFHAPAGVAPRFPFARMVTTLHDLIPLDTRPNDPDVVQWEANVRRTARTAHAVITASEFSKRRIVEALHLVPEKVHVIPWAPHHSPPRKQGPRQTLACAAGYVLHFGLADPRKNTARVLAAWATLPPAVREAYQLLIVGVQGPALARFQHEAAQLGQSVRVVGYVPEDEVRDLLAGATVLCYPTLYEGFGLPALDAMAAGVPVLTSTTTSLPEVVGDAAELVDPTDETALAAGLLRLLTDEAHRTALATRGRARATTYTWERTAEATASVFEFVATGRVDAGRG